MIIKPRVRGFICTTSHPVGCARNVGEQIAWVQGRAPLTNGPKNVLVVGASGGYGLPSRIAAAFGAGARTLGISFEKAPSERKTGTAGYYNNRAFEAHAKANGLWAKTLEGDAFSEALKQDAVDVIRNEMGPIDLVIYSLASPVRQDPDSGELWRSVIKPIGEPVRMKTLDVDRREVHDVDLAAATAEEIDATVRVMGGEDWERWIEALAAAEVLDPACKTVAYTYIGSELTWPIYWHATLGKAKEDLDRAAVRLHRRLAATGGMSRVAVLKCVATQSSAAIPAVPLYASLLFRVMKAHGAHEDCMAHIQRLFETQLYGTLPPRLDEAGRVRVDDRELAPEVQATVKQRWPEVRTDNLDELADFAGYYADFLRVFGFGVEGVDYEADVDPRTSGAL